MVQFTYYLETDEKKMIRLGWWVFKQLIKLTYALEADEEGGIG